MLVGVLLLASLELNHGSKFTKPITPSLNQQAQPQQFLVAKQGLLDSEAVNARSSTLRSFSELKQLDMQLNTKCWDTFPVQANSNNFRILPGAHPSGMGGIFDYYHFMIDWSAPMLFFLKDAGANVTIHAPCVAIGSDTIGLTFRLDDQVPKNRGSKAVWDRMFAYRNQHVDVVREHKTLTTFAALPWQLQQDKQEWSLMKPEIYSYFREFWWSAAKPVFPSDAHVLIIVRNSERRPEAEDSFKAALEQAKPVLDQAGVIYQIVYMAVKTQEEQVKLVAESRVVIGMHGAGLSNTVFLRPQSLVVEVGLRNAPCFVNLAHQAGLEYQHLPDPSSLKHAFESVVIPRTAKYNMASASSAIPK